MDNETNRSNVSVAFDMLLDHIDQEIDLVKQQGAAALTGDNLAAATAAISRVGDLRAFRDEVFALARKWQALSMPRPTRRTPAPPSAPGMHPPRRDFGRLPRGAKTPQRAYIRPILQTLVKFGGSADADDVLREIERIMGASFNARDLESLASNADEPRWRNTAQWTRWQLVKQGLLRRGSPRGVWEITDAGRRYLESNP
jgi:hypothetical protein